MKIKICSKCKKELPASFEFFHRNNNLKSKLHSWCKECCNAYKRSWHKKNKQFILKAKRLYYKENKELVLQQGKKYKQSRKGRETRRVWSQSERGKKLITAANERYLETEKGKDNRRRKDKNYYNRNKLSKTVSCGIRRSLKANKNGLHWEKLVPYTLEELKTHLENLFHESMSWGNYGDWHIDHIKPISSFNITSYDCDDFNKCWSLSNLQPLWAIDNLKKSNKAEDRCY